MPRSAPWGYAVPPRMCGPGVSASGRRTGTTQMQAALTATSSARTTTSSAFAGSKGQVRDLQRMVEEKQYCVDILTQGSASTKARLRRSRHRWTRGHHRGGLRPQPGRSRGTAGRGSCTPTSRPRSAPTWRGSISSSPLPQASAASSDASVRELNAKVGRSCLIARAVLITSTRGAGMSPGRETITDPPTGKASRIRAPTVWKSRIR
jgi:hypothetical protein